MDGILKCSRYAFGPNRLHYCGPDANREIFSYIQENISDPGLEKHLQAFETMYPYLKQIAEANNIKNPFDELVVEAYWIGNILLEAVEKKKFYRHLLEDHQIKKRIGRKSLELVTDKIRQGGVPHHSFHVLNIWKRTGHFDLEHTLESMDQCRISWGTVRMVDGPFITVETEPLIYEDGKLRLGMPVEKRIIRSFDATDDMNDLKIENIISIHWGVPCEVLSRHQAANLQKYTLASVMLANRKRDEDICLWK